jgi:hypothetical protein
MYAPDPVTISPRPARKRRHYHQPTPTSSRTHTTQVWELSTKLLVNGLLLTAMGASLARIVPYLRSQLQALQVAQAELAIAEQQTAHLRSDFERYFDPSQTSEIMQEQTGWESPSERQIVWIDPTRTEARQPESRTEP